jgi:hypothetical protein
LAFPKKLDFISGLGHSRKRRAGSGPEYLVSDLGQFDFQDGRLRLTHLHPGVGRDRVIAKTAFELAIADNLQITKTPSNQELELLRTEIDPLSLRELEMLSGAQRRRALRAIVQQDVKT